MTPIKSKIWDESIFQIFLKFDIGSNLRKIWERLGNFAQKLGRLMYEWVIFSWKLVFVCVYFYIPRRHVPARIKPEYPPRDNSKLADHCFDHFL